MRALIAMLIAILSTQTFAANSHCSKEEKIVFSCAVNKKIASICASLNLSPTEGYMQYRFGKNDAPELLFPPLNEHPLKYVDVNAYSAASGESGSIRFKNSEYVYDVHWSSYRSDSQSVNGSSIWLDDSGVAVEWNGKVIANLKCSRFSSGDVLEVDSSYLYSQVGFSQKENNK